MSMATSAYPFTYEVDPPAAQNRLSVFLRLLYVIPVAIVAAIVGIIAAIITLIAWIVILITGKYPAGMANFALNSWRMNACVQGYAWLLTDKYPSFSPSEAGTGAYPIRPNGVVQLDGRNRLTVFFRIVMLIPHVIILYFLNIAGQVVAIIGWFAALFTGSVPEGLHNFLVGWQRWTARMGAYASLLTDEYPPFSLS